MTYSYQCRKCGHTFEVQHSVYEECYKCPKCSGAVKRLLYRRTAP